MIHPDDNRLTLTRLRAGALAGACTLNLAGTGLTALPDEVIALAGTLEVLDIGRNRIETLPAAFARLRRLRILFGSGSPFRSLPEVLGECPSLKQIGFRGCGLETVPAASLPPALRWLTLTDNRIRTLPPALGALGSLCKLLLSGNRLSSLPRTFEGAASLELLRIGANGFATLPPFLAELPSLAWLGFAGNPAEASRGPTVPPPVAPMDRLTIGPRLGEGASGIVHAADWHRQGGRSDPVALKLFKGAITSDGLSRREIDAALACGPHAHLLGGLACVPDHPSGAPGLLLPRVPSDWRALAAPPSAETCSRDVYAAQLRLPSGVPRRIAYAVASAAAHLASRGMLHGDLYAHNVLWDGGTRGAARLGDLGAASLLPAGDAAAGLSRTDVLAWGILARELLDRAAAPDPTLASLAERASDPRRAARPSFGEIVSVLSPPTAAGRH